MARRSPDPDRTALMGSAAIHVGAVLLAFLSTLFKPEPLEFVAYEIDIVSPPPSVQAEVAEPAPPEEQLQVEIPEPTLPEPPQPEPVTEQKPTPQPEPEPEPVRETPKPTETEPETKPAETKPATTPDPDPSELSGEDIEVRMEGLRRDYPAYYDNIVRQIRRCLREPANARGEAVVQFFITREGGVADLQLVQRSASVDLDLAGIAAVECVGRDRRFGPLPEDLPWDRLPVRFRFTPPGR